MIQKKPSRKDIVAARRLAIACGRGFVGEALRRESLVYVAKCKHLSIYKDGSEYIALFDTHAMYRSMADVAVTGKTPKAAIAKALAEARKVATEIMERIKAVEAEIK